MPEPTRSPWRWLLLLICPLGWAHVQTLFPDAQEGFAAVTLLSTGLVAVALRVLGPLGKRTVHLWLLLVLYLLGYYIKFYVMGYFKLDAEGDYLSRVYPLENELFDSPSLLMDYCWLVTAGLGAMVASFAVLARFDARSAQSSKSPGERVPVVSARRIRGILVAAFVLTIVLAFVQVSLGIGFVSGSDRQVEPLPYRLAGIIMTLYYGALPLAFLAALWLADANGERRLARATTAAYLVFGLTTAVLSTSKALLTSTVISMAVLWLVTGRLSRRRLALLLSAVPFIAVLNGFLSVNRVLRAVNPDLSIVDVMTATLGNMLSGQSALVIDNGSGGVMAFLSVVMRMNGADSLLNILNFDPHLSLDRVKQLVWDSPGGVSVFYGQEVLGNMSEFDVAFSPSLLGFLLVVLDDGWLICLGLVLYVMSWHVIFREASRLGLMVEPILLSMLIVLLGQYTSEGTLESLPAKVLLTMVFCVVMEWLLRRALRGAQDLRADASLMLASASDKANA